MATKPFRSLASCRSMPNLTVALAGLVNDLAKRAFDRYRPELHYMRGPGPKWHAKHGEARAQFDAMPALARIRVKR
jgi:hypothetical protein